jgi:hypothetical protein
MLNCNREARTADGGMPGGRLSTPSQPIFWIFCGMAVLNSEGDEPRHPFRNNEFDLDSENDWLRLRLALWRTCRDIRENAIVCKPPFNFPHIIVEIICPFC